MGYKAYSKLYDTCVLTVLNYSAGVWSAHNNVFSECLKVHNRAQRFYLGVHRFVPLDGESQIRILS